MSKPNKTVAAARRRMGGFRNEPRPVTDPFMLWLFAQAETGKPCPWATIEQARAQFDAISKAGAA